MDNLLASNERTLVIFDSVCNGLAECLALVHIDIKQMTEHRNQLAELEQEKLRAKLLPAQELIVVTNDKYHKGNPATKTSDGDYDKSVAVRSNGKSKKQYSETSLDDDPYQLKLLDKRLADSFSQAISMCEKQKSLIVSKSSSVSSHNGRPSIFQMLLGKGGNSIKGSSGSIASSLARRRFTAPNCSLDARGDGFDNLNEKAIDNRVVIDDINKQTRLAMQYSKQLEAHLYKVEELKSKYEMHLKMGLVVRSVSRAYLAGGSTSHRQHSPTNSLSRRHYCSSLLINDSSSLGTHSSMSSLNLSSWSFSRNKAAKDRRESIGSDSRNSQKFISTISLNNQKNHKQRLSLARLISSSTKDSQQQQQEGYTTHYVDSCARLRGHGSPVSVATTDSPPSTGSSNNPSHLYEGWHVNELDSHINGVGCRQTLALDNDNLNLNNNNNNNNKLNSVDSSARSHSSLKRNLVKVNSKQQQVAPLQNQVPSKTTIREFIDNIDKIESELESYMGSFLLAVEDIQGFARICQGDVFEIIIKYGEAQKFKTRISVLKDNRQKCDNRQTVFKARIADVLAIKAFECKGLGKKVLLGHKLFETRDLFTARSQLMTISLNQTGTIKLNLIITWNPLHMAPNTSPMSMPSLDISHISLPPTPISSSTLSSVSSVPSINGTTTTINIQAHHRSKASNSPLGLDRQRARHHQSHHFGAEPQAHHALESGSRGYHIPPPDYITNDVDY